MEVEIKKIQSVTNIHLDLLLLADPSIEKIKEYLIDSEIYTALINDETIGIIIIKEIDHLKKEIMNVAVKEEHQNKGLGKKLINFVINIEKNNGTKIIEIGTGNSSINQLLLYQKIGFRIASIERDFFSRNYQEVIIENGIICKDMIKLSIEYK
ncbi:GNAT family N-acetyltransferase [Leptospira sp. 201903075]|uniref:GNAT family N-acetyltransferase n=1 Tax=Leptospira chreensis TaxID=2810035 RepID=UPI0019657C45|nr:GNAT family N-acetyltransferase [Leptospira chreensis]MBM9590223.1 GNAT family N-acetyltransferase [Leptospira chreensis]